MPRFALFAVGVMGGVVTGEDTGVLGAPPFCVLVGVPPVCVLVPEAPVDASPVDEVGVDPGVAAVPEGMLSEPPQPLNKPINATVRAAARRLKVNMVEP